MPRHSSFGSGRFGVELRRLLDDPAELRSLDRALDEAHPGGAILWPRVEESRLVVARMPDPAPAVKPVPAAAPAGEPATFPDDIDGPAIAKAKREAARLGVPFCEECTRRKLARERAASAASGGEA